MKTKEIDVSNFTAEQFDAFLEYCQYAQLKVGEGVVDKIREWMEHPISVDGPDDSPRCLYIRDHPEDRFISYGTGLRSKWQPDVYDLYRPTFQTKCVMTLGKADKYVVVGDETISLEELKTILAKQGVFAAFGGSNV
ncbi:hypothetical protein QE331_gp070 [Pseudomonas phage 20Sep416]|nr:hypothetical protein PaP1_gp003 [Pseudomonas phage PaP1]YP_008859338.1 hypothetical protein PAK_P400127 [Pseudomonas phage PAK_P4]YP_009623412.1 hypothetical protein FDJ38_gp005 [Pseudomonas phage vB_PaeM_C2-10_Ab02]YP_010762619.1 hypothetical protein QE325_gp148 [Pseudomonas phage pPA-3099-2aT.2]YP_010763263.1 hypothetical protein QE329_gp103 [Pseudomonas phage PhL_UNISO_PA-DSM_ph0034]YP_010763594.1 hypothetical protein QE331_gp070 [Pseudomonas phage 20Sep416]YP_010764069.1 hypothetical p